MKYPMILIAILLVCLIGCSTRPSSQPADAAARSEDGRSYRKPARASARPRLPSALSWAYPRPTDRGAAPAPPQRGNAAADDEGQRLTVSLKVPDAGWRIHIRSIYLVQDELWVISRLTRSQGMAAQVISTVRDSATVAGLPGDLEVRHFVIGKTWGWENGVPYTFIRGRRQIAEGLRGAVRFYSADEVGGDGGRGNGAPEVDRSGAPLGALDELQPLNQGYIPMH